MRTGNSGSSRAAAPVTETAAAVVATVTPSSVTGLPEEDIGLAHRDPSTEEPSTGCRPQDGRLVQLVTHARVRMGEDYLGLFQQHQGAPRALMIYDETMFRADARPARHPFGSS